MVFIVVLFIDLFVIFLWRLIFVRCEKLFLYHLCERGPWCNCGFWCVFFQLICFRVDESLLYFYFFGSSEKYFGAFGCLVVLYVFWGRLREI